MRLTGYHAKYYAHELTKRSSSDNIDKLASSLLDAKVDLNPHQVDAALFAFRSPLSRGAILADEVGLGKTIEAGIVISQKWAEKKRRILIIVPANLRKQWSQELMDKFYLPSVIMETKSFNETIRTGNLNPFDWMQIIICSYHFARSKDVYISKVKWDLIVIDEAHRLRNVYKPSSKIAIAIKNAVMSSPKILLTATPLQNSLLELYGLVSIIDDHAFGDIKSFKSQYVRITDDEHFNELKSRLAPICKRTLRRQVLEYINYTNRLAVTQEYYPYPAEQKLYDIVSSYLQRDRLYALPASQRHLMTLILRRLLASSSFAIADTLGSLNKRLRLLLAERSSSEPPLPIAENFDFFDDLKEEWNSTDQKANGDVEDSEEDDDEVKGEAQKTFTPEDIAAVKDEIKSLAEYEEIAKAIVRNAKGDNLISALRKGFAEIERLGGQRKAIIFTESTRTQLYIQKLLESTEFKGKTVLFNGSNNDPQSKEIYARWLARHQGTDRTSGSPSADKRASIVDYFKDEAVIMIATEAAAEGINLQFCSLVVNYDLPWNPQRIEQRIGRCHRYGQRFDVVVVNFLNKSNAADQRVYQILSEKFKLFDGVFGASDEILGSIESGVEFEKRIAQIYQQCRTANEIKTAFDSLQNELEDLIVAKISSTRSQLLENFDEEVHEKLRLNLASSRKCLSKYEEWLWRLTRYALDGFATFSDAEGAFILQCNPYGNSANTPLGLYRFRGSGDDAHVFRMGHPLAQCIVGACRDASLPVKELRFDYSGSGTKISILEGLIGASGWLAASSLTVSALEDEDYVLLSGFDDEGNEFDVDQAARLFSLPAEVTDTEPLSCTGKAKLDASLKARENAVLQSIAERNGKLFDEEMDKLDSWAEDCKNSLEIELKQLDVDIKTRKTEARKIAMLEKKIQEQRAIKNMERRRNELRQNLYSAQDEVDKRKEELLSEVASKLKQKLERQRIMTIRWKIF